MIRWFEPLLMPGLLLPALTRPFRGASVFRSGSRWVRCRSCGRWGGPPEGPVRELVDVPLRVLLELVVVAALRAGVAETGPAACFVRGVVLVVALGGGPAADGAGAGGVPDLGQVPQPDPGIVAFGSRYRWSQGSVVTGSSVMIRSGPGPGVRSRQVPGSAVAPNANPGPSRAPGPARFL